MHESMKALTTELLKSTLAACLFIFRIISKQEN